MADIDPAPSWAPIRQLETTDRNLAGQGGILNTQPVSIAARLNLLRDNATALNNTVAGVSSRQDSADSAIASLESQVLDAPGTLSDLDHGAPISVTGDQFPDVLSIDNSRGPVLALNESIADLAQRDEWLNNAVKVISDRIESIENQEFNGISSFNNRNPLFMAHRGNALRSPENTIIAFSKVSRDSRMALELDIRSLSDGTFCLMHDATVDRTTNGNGNVTSFNPSSFESLIVDVDLTLGSNSGLIHPPLLSQFINQFSYRLIAPQANAFIDRQTLADYLSSLPVNKGNVLFQADFLVGCEYAQSKGFSQTCYISPSESPAVVSASGVKWVAIQYSLIDQALVDSWSAVGVKVLAYVVPRRFVRDSLKSIGVSGFFSDDSDYLAQYEVASSEDNFSAQTWLPGMLSGSNGIDEPARGRFYPPNYWGWETTGNNFVLQGWASPIKGDDVANNWEMELSVKFDSGTGWASVFIASNDREFRDSATPNSPETTGWHLLMRTTGAVQIYKRSASSTASVANVAGSAISSGIEVNYKINVTPSSISLSKLDVDGTPLNTAQVSDPDFRGGYIHLGHLGTACKFRNIKIN